MRIFFVARFVFELVTAVSQTTESFGGFASWAPKVLHAARGEEIFWPVCHLGGELWGNSVGGEKDKRFSTGAGPFPGCSEEPWPHFSPLLRRAT